VSFVLLPLLCCNLFLCAWSFRTSVIKRLVVNRKSPTILSSSFENDDDDSSLWKERVQYVDLSNASPETATSRPLPLFLLGGAFYPQGTTFLNVFEMKYRTMMFDVANSDELFGYIHTNQKTGQIASVGTLCKIVDRQLLEDGRQYIAIEGVGRFKVNKILKTLPYVLAEVEPDLLDDVVDVEASKELEIEVYQALKYYMRLMKCYDGNKGMVVSQATRRNRPGQSAAMALVDDNIRRTDFSFSIANMIQMTQAMESQLLLQTTDVMKRLKVEKKILSQAAEVISGQLIKLGAITEQVRDDIKLTTFKDDDGDEDILPPEYVEVAAEEEKDEWDLSNME